MPASKIETVVNLCKRRGLVYPAGEIYGGTRSAWDYGPLGVELKENIKRQWWRTFVTAREDMVGLDSSIILPRKVWEASGHVETFTDPLVECLNCHKRHRQDHMQEAYAAKKGIDDPDTVDMTLIACPDCGTKGQWTDPREFGKLPDVYIPMGQTAEIVARRYGITREAQDAVIAAVEEHLADGKSVVLQLVTTAESILNRRLGELSPDERADLEIDLSPREYV